jgi:hypothetical protein
VRKTGVIRPRIGEVTHAELVNPAQALDFTAIQQVNQPSVSMPVKRDVVVQRIAEDFV